MVERHSAESCVRIGDELAVARIAPKVEGPAQVVVLPFALSVSTVMPQMRSFTCARVSLSACRASVHDGSIR